MALTNKKIQDTVAAIGGDTALKIVDFLKNKKNISEFIIAEKTKLDMQTTRNTLYKLNGHNVATYIRKKDRQKGWYISYWTFNKKGIKDVRGKMKRQQLEKLKERLKKEEENRGNFFICRQACARLDFDQATEFEFKCPECGDLVNQQDNSKTIENIKEKIKELETKISS
jgi:transcription initiation factor TFIIE subunit alpha